MAATGAGTEIELARRLAEERTLVAAAGPAIGECKPADAAGEVELTGELGEGTQRLEFTSTGGLTRIKVILPNRSYGVDGTDLVVKVPAGSDLTVNTVSADLRVAVVHGASACSR